MEIVRTIVGWVLSLTTANVVVIVIVGVLIVAGLVATRPKTIEAVLGWVASIGIVKWVMSSLTITDVVVAVVVVGLLGGGLYKCNGWTEQELKIVSVVDPSDPATKIKKVVWKGKATAAGAMWANCGLPKTLYEKDAFGEPRLFVLGFEGAGIKSGANQGRIEISLTPWWLKPATKRLTRFIDLSFRCTYTLYYN
ncbi:MAG: hypothetical protein ABII72_01175 [Parcubacteria group bacterium]